MSITSGSAVEPFFHPFSRLATAVTTVTSGGDYLLKFGGFKVLKNS